MRYLPLIGFLVLPVIAQASVIYMPACKVGVAITDKEQGVIEGVLIDSECTGYDRRQVRISFPVGFNTENIDTLRVQMNDVGGMGPDGPAMGLHWEITGMTENGLPVSPLQFPPISVELD